MKLISPQDIKHTNQRLLVRELQKRDIAVFSVDDSMELIKAEYKGHEEYILDRFSSLTTHTQVEITADKYLAEKIMQSKGICVNKGDVFNAFEIEKATEFSITNLQFPVVLKPNWGSHGDDIRMNITNTSILKDAINNFSNKFGPQASFLIEEQFDGSEYRVFIAKNGQYAVLNRDPAYVIGDGKNTIQYLIEQENQKRKSEYSEKSLCPIQIDEDLVKDIHYVPQLDEKCYVRSNSNLAKGGFSTDVTDSVHPSLIEIAKIVLQSFSGLGYAGIDILSKNPFIQQTNELYRVLEVNSNPGFSMHMFPGQGLARNVATIVVDMLFPETVS